MPKKPETRRCPECGEADFQILNNFVTFKKSTHTFILECLECGKRLSSPDWKTGKITPKK